MDRTLLLVAVAALSPFLAALVLVGARRPEARLLPLYAAVAPFGSGAALPLGLPRQYTSISSLLLLLLLVSLSWHLLVRGSVARRLPPPVPVFLFLLALLVASAVTSIDPGVTLGALPVIGSLVVLFCLLTQRPVSGSTVRRVENGALVGGVAASFYAFYGAATGTLVAEDSTSARFGADLLGANHTAAALALPFVVAAWRFLETRGLPARLLYGSCGGLVMVAVALTGSRGGLLALGAGFVIVAVHSRRPVPVLVVGGAVLVVAVGAMALYSTAGIGGRNTESSSGRLDIWRIGLAACQEHCLTGAGWATFPTVYETYAPGVTEAKVLRRGFHYEAHNVLMQVVVETGVAGMLLVLAGLWLTLRMALAIPRAQRAPPLAALVALYVSSMFLSNFEFKYFWLTLSYVALCSLASSGTGAPAKAGGRRPEEVLR